MSCMSDDAKMRELSIQRPCIFERKPDKRINAYAYIGKCQNGQCNEAVRRIVPNVDLNAIKEIIYDIPDSLLHNIYKEFYCSIMEMRHDLILEPTYMKLLERDISYDYDDHDDR